MGSNAKVAAYLKSFYKTDFRIGKTVETKLSNSNSLADARTVEFESVKLSEIFVGVDERARGYIVTDKETDEFLYFVDVDRDDLKLFAYNVAINETLVKENIDLLQEWASSNGFDFIKLFEGYNAEIAAGSSERRRFWGWTAWTPVGGCDEGFQTVVRTHYILGLKMLFNTMKFRVNMLLN
ncbi:hypothetical protein WFZ85_07955 [Flavobacterium sp. j3]|uniref:Uncharacterized protein n=1 Tax=Flavobacterium aureirubrum TaxID=3133147 RepID=A0ABU9N4U8_9FLAO